MQKYISINDYWSWCFEEPPVSKEDLAQIFPLSKEYCAELWNHYISDKVSCLPLAYTEREHWFWNLKYLDYNYIDDFNNDITTNFIDLLHNNFLCSKDDMVIYFVNKFDAIETTFDVFLRNWMNFLYEDEHPILFCVSTGFAIMFSPDGGVYGGKRPSG